MVVIGVRGARTLVRLVMLVAALVAPCAADDPADDYVYEATRALVHLVERAAVMIEEQGSEGFAALGVPGSEWFTGQVYFFAYTLDGTCVFHAESPDLVNRNLIELRDLNGKPVIRNITDVGRRPEKGAADWVFYYWQEGTELSPSWKGAYVRKVVAPDGTVYVLGSGLYDIKIERRFVERQIDRAVELLAAQGIEAAFQAFRDRSSPFTFLDTYVFVLDDQGNTLVDPSLPNEAGRDMKSFQDAVGMHPVVVLLDKLGQVDDAWVQYLWLPAGEVGLRRKLIYARKVTIDGKVLIVGSDFLLATPIWMRVEEGTSWPIARPT